MKETTSQMLLITNDAVVFGIIMIGDLLAMDIVALIAPAIGDNRG
jgi:hypothetical protein